MKTAKGVKTGRNIIFDIILTLFVFGLIGTGLFFFLKPEKPSTVQVEYKLIFEAVDKNIATNVTPNDEFLLEDGESAGIIKSALIERMTYYTLDRTSADRGYITNYSNEYSTVRATIAANAEYDGETYYIGGQPLWVGESITVRLTDFYGTAKIVAVTVITEGT